MIITFIVLGSIVTYCVGWAVSCLFIDYIHNKGLMCNDTSEVLDVLSSVFWFLILPFSLLYFFKQHIKTGLKSVFTKKPPKATAKYSK